MSAYLIIKAKVSDWEKFKQYTDVVPAIVKQYGGEYIVMDGAPELIEGQSEACSMVVSKWQSKAAAHCFWQSPEYKKALPLRENTGEFQVMLVNGL